MMDRYGVIGHPIGHSKSPVIHAQFARQTGQNLTYEAIDIAPDELVASIDRLVGEKFKGLNVTVPHKNAVVGLMDDLSERARLAGAVNTISIQADGQLLGENTDGIGLVRDLRRNLSISIKQSNILILGAGGATRGIVPTLLDAGPKQVVIANRSVEKAEELVTSFSKRGKVSACRFDDLGEQRFNLIVNATSAGLDGDVPPFPASIIGPDVACYDLSYAMTQTPFNAWAREHGAEKTYQGWGMLIEQAAESFRVWRGVRPETAALLANLP